MKLDAILKGVDVGGDFRISLIFHTKKKKRVHF